MPSYGFGFEPFDLNNYLSDFYKYLEEKAKVYTGEAASATENVIASVSSEHLEKLMSSPIPDLSRVIYGNAYDTMRANHRRHIVANMNRADFYRRAAEDTNMKRKAIIRRYAKDNKDLSEIMNDNVLGSIHPDIWARIKDEFDVHVVNKKKLEYEIRKQGIPEDIPITIKDVNAYYKSKGKENV